MTVALSLPLLQELLSLAKLAEAQPSQAITPEYQIPLAQATLLVEAFPEGQTPPVLTRRLEEKDWQLIHVTLPTIQSPG